MADLTNGATGCLPGSSSKTVWSISFIIFIHEISQGQQTIITLVKSHGCQSSTHALGHSGPFAVCKQNQVMHF